MGWFDLDASCYLRAGGTILSRDGLRLRTQSDSPLWWRRLEGGSSLGYMGMGRPHLDPDSGNRPRPARLTCNGLRCGPQRGRSIWRTLPRREWKPISKQNLGLGWHGVDATGYVGAAAARIVCHGLRLAPLPARPLRRLDFHIEWYSVFWRHLGMEWGILVTAIFNRSEASIQAPN